MAAERVPYLSPEEYLAIEREAEFKSEYISGQMYAMAGASREHGTVVSNAHGLIFVGLRGKPCRSFVAYMRVNISETGMYAYPDIVVVCGDPHYNEGRSGDTLLNPTVIIEVLSRSTENYDRGEKWLHYRHLESLRAYVLIHQNQPLVEYYHRANDGENWQWEDVRGLDATLQIAALDCAIPLADLYERVTLPEPLPGNLGYARPLEK